MNEFLNLHRDIIGTHISIFVIFTYRFLNRYLNKKKNILIFKIGRVMILTL